MLLLMVPVGGWRRKRRFGRYAFFVPLIEMPLLILVDV